jgi:hypothetical protein
VEESSAFDDGSYRTERVNTEQRRNITIYLEELKEDFGGYQAAPGEGADDDPQREGKLQLVA